MYQIHKLIREAEKAQYPVQEEGKELKHGKKTISLETFYLNLSEKGA